MPPSTALLMSDNRAPVIRSTESAALTYPALALALNAVYAARHGYALLYYQMVAPSCRHAWQGERHASYCKLPAIAHALRLGYDRVAFIDSDSFFQHRNLSLGAILRAYRPPQPHAPSTVAAWFACDLPQLGDRPNGGFHMWLAGRDAPRLLRTWWHLDGGGFNTEHDYEQHTLQWSLSHLREAVPLMGTLQMKTMDDTFHHAIAHIDHTKAARRLWLMAIALLEAALELPPTPPTPPATASGEGAAALPLLPPLSPKRTQRLARLVRQARAAPLDGAAAALQRRVAQAAAELLGGSACAARLTEDGGAVRCGGGGDGGGGGGGGGGSGSELRWLRYNATREGAALLPPSGLLAEDGLPLTLLPCGEGGEGGEGGAGGTGGGREAGWRQRWVARDDGQWALAAAPALCLHVGPRKAPKTPYPMLAQLRRWPHIHICVCGAPDCPWLSLSQCEHACGRESMPRCEHLYPYMQVRISGRARRHLRAAPRQRGGRAAAHDGPRPGAGAGARHRCHRCHRLAGSGCAWRRGGGWRRGHQRCRGRGGGRRGRRAWRTRRAAHGEAARSSRATKEAPGTQGAGVAGAGALGSHTHIHIYVYTCVWVRCMRA